MTLKASTQSTHFAKTIQETDSTSVTKLVMERTNECEKVETIRYAQNVLKASRTAMDGAQSSPAKALVLKVLSASTVGWALIGIEKIGDSRIGKIETSRIGLHEVLRISHERLERRMLITIWARTIAGMESVAELNRGSEAIMTGLLPRVCQGTGTVMATSLVTEDGERRTTMMLIVVIEMIEMIAGGIGTSGMSQSLRGWTNLLTRRAKLILRKISRNGKKNNRTRTEVVKLQLRSRTLNQAVASLALINLSSKSLWLSILARTSFLACGQLPRMRMGPNWQSSRRKKAVSFPQKSRVLGKRHGSPPSSPLHKMNLLKDKASPRRLFRQLQLVDLELCSRTAVKAQEMHQRRKLSNSCFRSFNVKQSAALAQHRHRMSCNSQSHLLPRNSTFN